MLLLLLCLLLWLALSRRHQHRRPAGFRRADPDPAGTIAFPARKPDWVRHELIRLKARMPGASCRTLAETFNRLFAHRAITVGKTFVADVLRESTLEIVRLRRELRHRVPRPMPPNRTWALDLTGKADLSGRQQLILGLLDHGTRACLRLTVLTDKRSLTILRELIAAFRRFGLPQHLRVDNEICFNSALMKTALALLGVRLQTIALHCPWQNGRIERFFGTLKRGLDLITMTCRDDLRVKLTEFRAFYNHVRPHQHLHGHTPAETWHGHGKSTKPPHWVEIWDGRITGWYFPP